MAIKFQIKALRDTEFSNLFELNDLELAKLGALRMTVDKSPGFPCRVSLQDAKVGEEVILLPYQHHKTASPYQASGPIFVRKQATTAQLGVNEIPEMLTHRLLSLRGYNSNGLMEEALVVDGTDLPEQINQIFGNEEVNFIHIHNAKPGCYNCTVERAR